jgi:hypothetical protein
MNSDLSNQGGCCLDKADLIYIWGQCKNYKIRFL